MCSDLFSVELRLLKNKENYFPTKQLVQCVHHAQPESLREKLHFGSKRKSRLCGSKIGLYKQLETFLSHGSVCSVYGRRRAGMQTCKSSCASAESQKVDFVFESFRSANQKKHHFLTKTHVQCMEHAEQECLHVKAPTCEMQAKK